MQNNRKFYSYKSNVKKLLVGTLDCLGNLFCFYQNHKSRENRHSFANPINRILIVRLDHIGDFILTLPAIQKLRHYYPEAQIDLVTDSALVTIAERSALFNTVISTDQHWFKRKKDFFCKVKDFFKLKKIIRSRTYDLGIDFRGDFRNILLLYMSGIRCRLGYANTGGGFLLARELYPDETLHQTKINDRLIQDLVKQNHEILKFDHTTLKTQPCALVSNLPASLVVIHSGAGEPDKAWPESHFRIVIDHLLITYPKNPIVIVGTAEEKSRSILIEKFKQQNIHDLRGETKIEDMIGLFEKTVLFIGNDSGIGHIAALFDFPIISIFSDRNNPERWKPFSPNLSLISGNIHQISVDNVLSAVQKAMERHE